MNRQTLAGGAIALALAAGVSTAIVASDSTQDSTPQALVATTPAANCEYPGPQNAQACFAAGVIRNVSLSNLQGAAQFCKWRSANPGEWTRLKGYASSGTKPTQIVTWLGAHILNDLEAYFAAGAPPFTIAPNTAPNVCRTPLAPPIVAGVTPGQTDATVTVTTTP